MSLFLPDRTTLISLVSGLLLALCWPRVDATHLCWIALVPLLLVMENRPFRSGFAAGVGFFSLLLYWLNIVMTTFGKLPAPLSLVVYLLLVAYLSLYIAAATWASSRVREKLGLPYAATLPIFWVACEFLRSFVFTGFPWGSLGYALVESSTLLQAADLFGVYGLSALIVFVNAVLAAFIVAGRRHSSWPWRLAATAVLLLALTVGYGRWRLAELPDESERQLAVGLIQGNIEQGQKWNPDLQQRIVTTYADLSLRAAKMGAKLLIWPESATPVFFQDGGPLAEQVSAIPERSGGSSLLFGSPAYTWVNRERRFLNSAYLLDGEGVLMGRSDKIHLVPFGEYVPMARFLPFVHKLVEGIGDFSPGTVSPLPLNQSLFGVLVCYEAIFPEIARDYVNSGSDLLVNITNDAWYGRSSAPFQHLAIARMRAVENRVWLARAANTGISAIIAPSGEVIASTLLFTPDVLNAQVGLGSAPTLYKSFGDTPAILSLLLGLFWLIRTRQHYSAN
ncbi:MAG: apolipoprotein N-acyltransferase [Desulfuromonas sp.]|nr:MAG: apolipoprotein N-acyltransferase [Desulfuromonas sp.]